MQSDSVDENDCKKAKDHIYTQIGNGWEYSAHYQNHDLRSPVTSWAVFNIGGGPMVARLGIISGIGRRDAAVHDFEIKVKSRGVFQNVTGLTVLSDFSTAVAFGNRVNTSREFQIQLSFDPIIEVEAVKLTMYATKISRMQNIIIRSF
jgi:hypothetical protein